MNTTTVAESNHRLSAIIKRLIRTPIFWFSLLLPTLTIAGIEIGRRSDFTFPIPFLLLFAAVVVAATLGGILAGLLAATQAAVYILFAASIGYGPFNLTGTLPLALTGCLLVFGIALLLGKTRAENLWLQQNLRETNQTLEAAVAERTSALKAANEQLAAEIESQRATAALLGERESQLQAILDSNIDLICRYRPDTTLTFVNDTYCRFFNKTRDELIGSSFLQFADPAQHEHITDRISELLRDRTPQARQFHDGALQQNKRWFQWVDQVVTSASGETLIQAVGRDVTEQVKTLNALRESEQRWQSLVESHPEPILISVGGNFVYSNPAGVEAFGAKSLDDLIGLSYKDFAARDMGQIFDDRVALIEGGQPTTPLEHDIITLDGAARTIISFSIPIQYHGQQAAQTVVRDITQQRRFQRELLQQERLAAVGQLAAGIAHDFNNILAVISVYGQLLRRTQSVSKEGQRHLQIIDEQILHATELTNQILDFSRRSIMERRPIDLLAVLKETLELLDRTLPESITIECVLPADDVTIHADATRLQQAFLNLALNARDALPDGGHLQIHVARLSGEDCPRQLSQLADSVSWIAISFTDNGPGIPDDVLAKIFEPFFTTKGPDEGTGLGLAQVYGIVKQHDGEMVVSSSPGQGTTFTLYLPEPPAATSPHSSDRSLDETLTGSSELVLVVEDDMRLRDALSNGLAAMGYAVVTAANGEIALDMLRQRSDEIALVISDVVMPKLGGAELLGRMREQGSQIPLVLMTGHPLAAEMEKLHAHGPFAWLSKPFTLEALTATMASVLKTSRSA